MALGRFVVTGYIWRVVEDDDRPAIKTFADEASAYEFWHRRDPSDPWQEPVECEVVTFIPEGA